MPLKKRVNQHLEIMACITPSSPRHSTKGNECLFLFLFSLQNCIQTKYTFSISLRNVFLGKADLAALTPPVTSMEVRELCRQTCPWQHGT